ncbi:tyrosine-type recombinase/integrase [Acidiferrobacter thiooxydans]|jgi:integrase
MASFIPRKGPGGKRVWQGHVRRRGYLAQVKTFDTKAAAEVWARRIEEEIDRGVFVSRAEAEGTTLGDALDRYLHEITPTKKPSTVAREKNRIAVLTALPIARRSLASIKGSDIATFIRGRQAEGLGANAIRLDLALLSHVFTVAGSAWGMESLGNPVKRIRGQRPKLPGGRTRRLVDDEYRRLIETAAKDQGGMIGPLITWAIETAMRRGEIAAMRWEHLDRKARVLLIPETKTGSPRRVPLSTAALGVLDVRMHQIPRHIDGRVWGMRPDSISQSFERVCKAAGVEGLTFHDLRHEATSRLFEKGLNPMEVAAITGHKTLQMLKRYTHLRAEDLVGRLG